VAQLIFYGRGLTAQDHAKLRQLIHLADGVGGPMEEWPSGSVREVLPLGSVFPTDITWWSDATKTKRIVRKLLTYNASNMPVTIAWSVYAEDGVTAIVTVTDTIVYASNVFETQRTRTVFP
jgi:hypothetical protein